MVLNFGLKIYCNIWAKKFKTFSTFATKVVSLTKMAYGQ
jgi:hypothetical protein